MARLAIAAAGVISTKHERVFKEVGRMDANEAMKMLKRAIGKLEALQDDIADAVFEIDSGKGGLFALHQGMSEQDYRAVTRAEDLVEDAHGTLKAAIAELTASAATLERVKNYADSQRV
ncbi:hypothetical protein [Bradyrhizobium sp. NAS80.1]|uniref:hypothetical protein n=1 Tax=Bradyrhizobium sp. NAS80.1 TaxID=1680159 RepID=UPI0011610B8C|nr:hypothetical protein [Bradyrhizobium sp. NAS80.1]